MASSATGEAGRAMLVCISNGADNGARATPTDAGGVHARPSSSSRTTATSGDGFNKSYIETQLKAHEKTVDLLEKEISSGQDADAKAFAQSVLPTVKHHL